jgi:hypothetical protein
VKNGRELNVLKKVFGKKTVAGRQGMEYVFIRIFKKIFLNFQFKF